MNDRYCRLSDAAFLSHLRTKEINKETYISTENMIKNIGGVTVSSNLPLVKSASRYQKDDILISNIRPYFKKIWISNRNGSCSNDILVLKSKKDFLPLFLYYALSDNNFFNYATVTSKGTKMPRGTQNAIMKYLIPALGINEQKKIVNILHEYDKLLETNRNRIIDLEKVVDQLFKEWFVRMRFPGYENHKTKAGFPMGWNIVKIDRVIERLPFNQTYKATELLDEGKIIVVDQSLQEYIGFHNNEPSHMASFETPLLLFGDHSCKFQLMTSNFSLGENIIPFCSKDSKMTNDYFLYFSVHKLINTEEYKRHWSMLKSKKIILPNIELQNKFGDIVSEIIQLKEQLIKINKNLEKQRDLLLPRLLSGKLEVRLS